MEASLPQPPAAAAAATRTTDAAATKDVFIPGVGSFPGVPSAGPCIPPQTGGAFLPESTRAMRGMATLVAPATVGFIGGGVPTSAAAEEARLADADRSKADVAAKMAAVSLASAVQVEVKPKVVPPFPWAFDGPTIEFEHCTAQVAGEAMLSALVASRVDYDFNHAKCKAKCYVYDRDGYCFFIARLYARGGGDAGFVAELQLRDGSRALFGRKHKDVLTSLVSSAKQGDKAFVLPPQSSAASLARRLGLMEPLDAAEAAAIAAEAAAAARLPPLGGVPAELSLSALPAPSAVFRGTASATDPARTTATAQAVDEAVGAVVALLKAHYDDVATSGAEAALGIVESGNSRDTLASRVKAPPCPAFYALADALVVRAGGKNYDSARCRTLSAFAFEGLAADATLARALVDAKFAAGILDAVAFDARGAPQLFALRRAALRAVRALGKHAPPATWLQCESKLKALSLPPYAGPDPAFDAELTATVAELKVQ